MNLQGYQKMTLLDVPGKVAATLFCGGCNLRCPFCHNGQLVKAPNQSPSCTQEALAYLAQRRGLLDAVCVTGGEPLLQPDLPQLLQQLKEMGYFVKLDTNGSQPQQLEKLLSLGLVDQVAMDIKSAPEHYPQATGTQLSAELFAQSAALLRQSSLPHEFRTTLVKPLHIPAHVKEAAQWVGDSPYFLQNYKDSPDILCPGPWESFSPQEMQEFLHQAQKIAPQTRIRGEE